jgi:hypothetical protein
MPEAGVTSGLSIRFDPVGSWAAVAAVALALAAVLVLVGPDRTRVSGPRLTILVVLRALAFAVLVACILRPTIVSVRAARQSGSVILLADESESMTVSDTPGGLSRWDAVRKALEEAAPTARGMLDGGGFEILCVPFDRQTRPVAGTRETPFPLEEWERRESSAETAIGSALDDVARLAAGRRLLGVVLVGDGCQHAYPPRDLPPQTASRRLLDIGVPLWTVTVGQPRGEGQGVDAEVTSLTASARAYVGNVLEVAGRVRLDGLAGREVVVTLLAEAEDGKPRVVARTTLRPREATVEEPVRLEWIPTTIGERKLVLAVEPQDGEAVLTNNELSTFVEVVEGGLRVVYVEGALRVEQRFVRRALASSPDMQVDFVWIDPSRRDRWPVDLSKPLGLTERGEASDRARAFDVILVGDIDASAFRPDDLERVRDLVEQGAGIGLLGGFHAFDAGGWGFSPLAPLVPWEPDRLARQPLDGPIREGLHLRGPLRMLPDRRFGQMPVMRIGEQEDAESLRNRWLDLPPLDGANDLGRLLPQARPVAVSETDKPLLVTRDYGNGRVAALAADSTWRWAMKGAADEHRRFWRQLVLWLARRDDSSRDSLWLTLAQRRLTAGSTLAFDAGLSRPDGTAIEGGMLEAAVISPGGGERIVRALRRGEAFTGSVSGFDEAGDWTFVVRGSVDGAAAGEKRARFTVLRQDLELANPVANLALMNQLAGDPDRSRRLEDFTGILEELAEAPAEYDVTELWSATPWDSWWAFGLLAGCLCLEWALRKRFGLV